MGRRNIWIDLSVIGLCAVSLSGFLLRTKFIFAMPWLNYNYLLEAHSHFTFCGWISLALMSLMIREFLPEAVAGRSVYLWILGLTAVSAWAMLITFSVQGYSIVASSLFILFLLVSYLFSWIFLRDLIKTKPTKSVMLFIATSLLCLVLSSGGAIIIIYMHISGSSNVNLYRNALVAYLHFQYNGFFSLAVFGLLFKYKDSVHYKSLRKKVNQFAFTYCCSIIPSLFLTFLWADVHPIVRLVAVSGCLLVLLSIFLFVRCLRDMIDKLQEEPMVLRIILYLSLGSLILKMFLQGLTLFPEIGNAIFGSRPIIMSFLHLVFLGFVSLFILAYLGMKGFIDSRSRFARMALIIFAGAVVVNEILLLMQGLTSTMGIDSTTFPRWLWWAGICLFVGALLTVIARFQTNEFK